MLELSGISLRCGGGEALLAGKLSKLLRMEHVPYRIVRHSIDARKKPELFDVYSVQVDLGNAEKERLLLKRLHLRGLREVESSAYRFPDTEEGSPRLLHRPLVIGSGPAGLFCALTLARQGYRPLLFCRREAGSLLQYSIRGRWGRDLLGWKAHDKCAGPVRKEGLCTSGIRRGRSPAGYLL